MKTSDYKQLIYESLLYPEYAVKNFLNNKCQESGFSHEVFVRGLSEAYTEIKEFLNRNAYPPEWTEDENGNKEYVKNTINLLHVTNGKIKGNILSAEDLKQVSVAIDEMEDNLLPDKIKQAWEKTGTGRSLINFVASLLAVPDSFIEQISNPEIRERFIHWREIYANFKNNILPEASVACVEMGPAIINDYFVNPDPGRFLDFLGYMIDPELFHPSNNLTVDDFLRKYAQWRARQHYSGEKWHVLYSDLINAEYIKTTFEVFSYAMEYKKLPGGSDKIQWLTSHADAIFFADELKFSMKQLNECFISNTGTPFQAGSRPTTTRKRELIEILDKYRQ